MSIRRVLVANRGEIAVRIIRAAHALGIEAVQAVSVADRDSAAARLADQVVVLGPAPSKASYLDAKLVVHAAKATGCDALHPGYGFLSERAALARLCADEGVVFVGPDAAVIDALGDKLRARAIAAEHGVPLVPGTDEIASVADARKAADTIGYPVVMKASAGGGGRGMRPVHNEATLRSAFQQARAEAEAAFKDGTVFIEKLVDRPRHVEVQLLADKRGNVLHCWERDCSLQRRNQKLVEESPSPHISARTRRKLCEAAVRLAKAAKYYSAGTCEFLVDADENFYFMEVNTRIQVEHPVTELVTGLDLIQWMIRIAAGENLTLKQDDIRQTGSAIEVRINAESPADNFRPSPGKIVTMIPPGGPGVRLDTHAYAGYTVGPHYDSMIAKLLVHRPTRAQAIAAMRRALHEFVIDPIKTTIPLHQQIMAHPAFANGQVDTGFIERELMRK